MTILPERRPRLSYANVTATLALVLATTMSGAYAHGMIGSAQIRDNAVKSRHIANGHVKTADLGALAVGTGKLKDNAVTNPKIAAGAVSETKLADGAVVNAKLADFAVTTAKLANGSVTNAKIGDSSVNSAKLVNSSVTSTKIAVGAVRSTHLGTIFQVSADSPTVANNASTGITATCPAGSTVISGGFDGGGGGVAWRVQRSQRDGNGWRAFGTNQTGINSHLVARAYCLQG